MRVLPGAQQATLICQDLSTCFESFLVVVSFPPPCGCNYVLPHRHYYDYWPGTDGRWDRSGGRRPYYVSAPRLRLAASCAAEGIPA